jgi:aubergine-like protein
MKNDFNLMKSVGDFTRVSPSDRQAALVRFVKRIEESPEAKELLASWGLRLAREGPISLSGRLLDSEVLMFGGGYKERVNPAADFTRAATR